MDIKSKEDRSRNMAAIRSRDTRPEMFLRKELFKRGLRYRIADKRVFGKPDIYLPKYRTALFVNGCFWHRHQGCKYAYIPKSNVEFWQKKFAANIRRDAAVREELQKEGVKCLVIWECTIKEASKNEEYLENIVNIIKTFAESDDIYFEI